MKRSAKTSRRPLRQTLDGEGWQPSSGSGAVDSEQRRTAAEVGRSEERYRAIAEAVSDWAYALRIEASGRPVSEWTSPNLQVVSGYMLAELEERGGWLSLVHPEDARILERHLAALRTGTAHTAEYRIVTKSGESRWLRDYARAMWAEASRAIQVVGGVRDITARRQAELDRDWLISELEATREEFQRIADTAWRRILGPVDRLAASVGDLERGLASGDRERVHESVERIRQSIDSVRDTVDQTHELSSLAATRTEWDYVSLAELTQDALCLCRSAMDELGVQVETRDLPAVFGDRIRLLLLVRILIEHAIARLSRQREPRLEIGARPAGKRIVLSVRDNGGGSERIKREPADLELKLALARRIAELHGGTIREKAASEGDGATFLVDLPR